MTDPPAVLQVVAEYAADCQPESIEELGNFGGFSGASFWRVITPRGRLCLRRWPQGHPDVSRLQFIHRVIRHVHDSGFQRLPRPIETRRGDTFVCRDGQLWELAPWLPGEADYSVAPDRGKLSAAVRALAEFHTAAGTLPEFTPYVDRSPGILRRRKILDRWQAKDLQKLAKAVPTVDWPDLQPSADRIIAGFRRHADSLARDLDIAADVRVSLQPCIRDVWDRHVLYEGERVTGIIDFGAMSVDCTATDIARLLGSLAEDRRGDWEAGLAAYQEQRPLAEGEKRLIAAFDRSMVLLSGMNWLRWICLERRTFSDKNDVNQRLKTILKRLECVA